MWYKSHMQIIYVILEFLIAALKNKNKKSEINLIYISVSKFHNNNLCNQMYAFMWSI